MSSNPSIGHAATDAASASAPGREPIRGSRVAVRIAVVLLGVHAILLGWAAVVTGPNLDEPAHLAAGLSHWTFGRFEMYRVNPPLVKMLAALPVLPAGYQSDWSNWQVTSPYARPEFHVGRDFVLRNGETVFWYFTLARWACIPVCLLGAWATFLWGRDLYGDAAGLTAIWLYCFCPNLIAWGASITPDAAASALGVLACYTFWRWLQAPGGKRALLAGVTLGLALLSKTTWIILLGVLPLTWLAHRLLSPRRTGIQAPESPGTGPAPWQLAGILAVGVYLLNLGYGFEGTLHRLEDFRFITKALSGRDSPPQGANRFAGTWIGAVPVPLPSNYVLGLDAQRRDFEHGGWSYLCGQQRRGGWWYYYLAAFGFKSPLGTLAIFGLATVLILVPGYRSQWRNELALALPALVLITLVSSQTGFNRYLRYALPFAPFAFIHAGRAGRALARGNRPLSIGLVLCAAATAAESLSVFPHSMAFFNAATGGPRGGHAWLLDSNIDWSQEMLFLKRWYDQHPEARPFHLERFGSLVASPEAAGIKSEPVPGYLPPGDQPAEGRQFPGPRPGWFALSVNHLQGYRHYSSDLPQFTYFQRLTPIAQAGYSIYVFHLTLEDANRLRRELGLEPIAAPP